MKLTEIFGNFPHRLLRHSTIMSPCLATEIFGRLLNVNSFITLERNIIRLKSNISCGQTTLLKGEGKTSALPTSLTKGSTSVHSAYREIAKLFQHRIMS